MSDAAVNQPRRGLLAAGVAAAAGAVAALRPARGHAAEGDIVIGQIGPFTGMAARDAHELNQGMRAALAQVNAEGGVNGRALSLFELDDGFSEEGFLKQWAEASRRRPVALLSPVGVRPLQRMLADKLLDEGPFVVLNAVPGADSLRNPGSPWLFHLRASDQQQVERILRHARTLGQTQMAVLHQDTPVGQSSLAEAARLAEGLGLRLLPAAVKNETAPRAAVAAQVAAGPGQSAVVLGGPRFSAEVVVTLRQAGFGRTIYALSYVSPALLNELAQDRARGVALAQVFPNPNGHTLALQLAFQAAMAKAGMAATAAQPHNAFQLEGYVSLRVLAEGLRRSRDASPAGLARALRGMGELNLGGYRINFSQGNAGSGFVDIAMVNASGRLVY